LFIRFEFKNTKKETLTKLKIEFINRFTHNAKFGVQKYQASFHTRNSIPSHCPVNVGTEDEG